MLSEQDRLAEERRNTDARMRIIAREVVEAYYAERHNAELPAVPEPWAPTPVVAPPAPPVLPPVKPKKPPGPTTPRKTRRHG